MTTPAKKPSIPELTAEDVKRWRRSRRITTRRLAELLGMTSRGISIWEQGVRPPPWYAAALLHYLDCQLGLHARPE